MPRTTKLKQPTQKELLDARFRRLECIEKISTIKRNEIQGAVDTQKKRLELLHMKHDQHKIYPLLAIAAAYCVDNDNVIGSELKLKSIWDDEEMEAIKTKILQKLALL